MLPDTFSPARLRSLKNRFGSPLWVYDAAVIRARIAALGSFDVIRFAQKACSNTHILRLMREQGVKVDAVSRGEILRALAAELLVDGDQERLIRRRQTVEELLDLEVF